MLRQKRASPQPPPPFLDETEQEQELASLVLALQGQALCHSVALALVLAAASAFFCARVARGLSLQLVPLGTCSSSALDALAAASLACSSAAAAASARASQSRRRITVLSAVALASASLVALSWAAASVFPRTSTLPPLRFYAWLPFPSLLGALAARWLSRSIEGVALGIEEMKKERYRLKGA